MGGVNSQIGGGGGGGLSQTTADTRYIQKDGSTATSASIPLIKGVTIGGAADQGLIRIYDASFVPMFWRVSASPSLINRTLLLDFSAWTAGHTITFTDADGTVLYLAAADARYLTPAAAAAAYISIPLVMTQSTNFSIVASDGPIQIIVIDATTGNVTATLPTADQNAIELRIKRSDATGNTVTLAALGGETIDGAATITFAAKQSRDIINTDSSTWGIF